MPERGSVSPLEPVGASMLNTRRARAAAFVCAAGLTLGLAGPVASAGPVSSPCGKSFIDVDNNGVCSTGDVSLDAVLKPLSKFDPMNGGHEADINVLVPVATEDGTVIYTPPADGHPVGVVLGGTIRVNTDSVLFVSTTGTLTIAAHISATNEGDIELESCRQITVAPHSVVQDQGAFNEPGIALRAIGSFCLDTNGPATLDIGKQAKFSTPNEIDLDGDRVHLGDQVQLRSTHNTPIDTDGVDVVDAGELTMGKAVKIAGGPFGRAEIHNCGDTVSADRLNVNIGTLDWRGDGSMFCDTEPYDPTSHQQRVTLTNSSITAIDGGLVTNGDPGPSYPCDAITLIKTRVRVPAGGFAFVPTPRVNPSGPCTGTISG